MKKCVILLAGFSCILFSSCDLIESLFENIVPAEGTVYYWVSADADTYVECVNIAGCMGTDTDHSGSEGLVVAHTATSIKRTYVNFPGIVFPPGTVIEEAYFELFHSGKNEDGKTDNISLDVNRVRDAWNAGTLRYSNQPVPPGSGVEFNIRLESQNWSGSRDISFELQQDLTSSGNFQGFVVFISSFEPGYEKGFYSGNHRSRTPTDLGFAPRLLLKVTLPEGTSSANVNFDNVHADGSAGSFLGFQFRSASDWPADWNIAIRN